MREDTNQPPAHPGSELPWLLASGAGSSWSMQGLWVPHGAVPRVGTPGPGHTGHGGVWPPGDSAECPSTWGGQQSRWEKMGQKDGRRESVGLSWPRNPYAPLCRCPGSPRKWFAFFPVGGGEDGAGRGGGSRELQPANAPTIPGGWGLRVPPPQEFQILQGKTQGTQLNFSFTLPTNTFLVEVFPERCTGHT